LGAAGSLQKKIFHGCKKSCFLSTRQMPVFIGRNSVIFTKIHQTGKSCQSYRRFQNTICFVIGWKAKNPKLNHFMSKMRSDSTWNGLSAEQRLRFEGWLFDENLSYQEVRDRAERELGVAGSKDSVGRYCRSRREAWESAQRSGVMLARLLNGAGPDAETLKLAAEKALGMRFLEVTMEGGEVKEMCALGRMVLNTERRGLDEERLELSRARLGLDIQKLAQEGRVSALSRENPELSGTSEGQKAAKCG
jgi:hypothetical protein